MAKDRQSSWAAGELTPDLHGQAGSPAYRQGAALLKNFLVTPQGTLINRSGSVYLATLGSATARLVPFLFGGDEPRLMQLYGPGIPAMRTPDGSFAVSGANDTTGDTTSPTRAAVLEALRRIRVAQCAGTMTIARPDKLQDLRRVDATHYTTVDVDFLPPAFGSSANPYSTANNKRDPAIETAATGITIKAIAGDATHPAREWDYVVTRVVSIASGNPDKPNQVIETLPRTVTAAYSGIGKTNVPGRETYTVDKTTGVYTAANVPAEIAVYGDWLQRIDVSGAAGDPWVELATTSRTGTIVAHRVYRGRGGVYGYIGETTTRDFVDDGRDPDIANPPPAGTNPFLMASGAKPPVAVAFSGDRRILANREGYPNRVFGSAVGNWSDFDEGIAPDDADALSFDLAANQHQEVRHLLASQVLLALAEKATWAAVGSGNLEVLTPTAIAARKALPVGAAHYPAPIEGDGAVFFIEAKGGRPYAMTTDGNGAAQFEDLSLRSSHLFENHTIVDWAWARDPYQTLWAARDDGKLLSLAYAPGPQVQAWALHEIAPHAGFDAIVEAVAVLPIGHEDLLYIVVNRNDVLLLERLAPRIVDDSRLACHLDCATILDGRKAFFLNVAGVNGDSNYLIGEGTAPFEVELVIGSSGGLSVGNAIMFPDINGNMVRATVTFVSGTDVIAAVTDFSGDTLQINTPHRVEAYKWGIEQVGPVPMVGGSPWLDSGLAEASAVIDGAVFTGLQIGGAASGYVALPATGLVVVVGLPYKSQFQSLSVAQEAGKQKVVSHALVKLSRSRGGAVGADFDHLTELPPRNVEDGYGVPEPRSELVRVPVDSQIKESAEIVIEQSQPKPIRVLFVEREYTLGG